MAADKLPAVASAVQESVREQWSPDTGTVQEIVTRGLKDDVKTRYDQKKAFAPLSKTLAGLEYQYEAGRATLVERYVRTNKDVEELYALVVLKDIFTAPYFQELSDAQIVAVRDAWENKTGEDAGWVTKQKSLYTHLARGVESYRETNFIFRLTTHAMSTSGTVAAFTNINKKVDAPTPSGAIAKLLGSLPAGEWLYGCPEAQYLGRGKWAVRQEWEWAEKWSVLYGGTFGAR